MPLSPSIKNGNAMPIIRESFASKGADISAQKMMPTVPPMMDPSTKFLVLKIPFRNLDSSIKFIGIRYSFTRSISTFAM